jgi:hypothetical protein
MTITKEGAIHVGSCQAEFEIIEDTQLVHFHHFEQLPREGKGWNRLSSLVPGTDGSSP